MEKSGNFKNFPKKLLVNRPLEILFSINCKDIRLNINIPFSNIYGLRFFLKIKSASINIYTNFSNCRMMKMAKIGLPKGSGKQSKVRE